MKNSTNIVFIGAGNMGSSLIGGLIANGHIPSDIIATDTNAEKLALLQQEWKITVSNDNAAAAEKADILILAVKPQYLKSVALEIASSLQHKKPLVISIAAGITVEHLQRWLGSDIAIVRCMPNTPALLRCGITGLFANKNTSTTQKEAAESILRAVGITIWMDNESLLDVVTALSGSGPAYFFLMMEALQEEGIKLGLTPEAARLLTVQTGLGAARMALETSHSLAELRKQVTSPGGTTEAAIKVLESSGIRKHFADAVKAAQQRAHELAAAVD